ncbi:MAG: hypothetical protein ACXVDN_02650, partial [Ktedonobacteraceae bacterium]
MALQTRNLVMVGLGIATDTPVQSIQPPLVDGIHLRWAFQRQRGFPWYGFYLFRRKHQPGDSLCLGGAPSSLKPGRQSGTTITTPDGQFSSDAPQILTDLFAPAGVLEFDLAKRRFLRFQLAPEIVARRIEVRIGLREDARITVKALLWGTRVVERVAAGKANEIVTLALEFDAITEVEIEAGPASLLDICLVPVAQNATLGWEPIPGFVYPLALPLTHPDYPCTSGMAEALAPARYTARNRIRYGDPDQFTALPAVSYAQGTVAVTLGSSIVTGKETSWQEEMVGSVFQVSGDPTAYMIVGVLSASRLLLSRGYQRLSGSGKAYTINRDHFAQLHDQLIHLVRGGQAAGSMSSRFLPESVHHAGTISVTNGSSTINGAGTGWHPGYVGLGLQVSGEAETYTIVQVDSPTSLQVERSYLGSTGTGKSYTLAARFQSVEPDGMSPLMPRVYPLDLVLLGALHPALAEMVGLAWTDSEVDPAVAYDYLILADPDGRLGLDAGKALSWLQQTEQAFATVDGYIVFQKKLESAQPLAVLEDVRVYALPGGTIRRADGLFQDASNNTGLRWERDVTDLGVLLPGRSVFYHLWRADLGNQEPAEEPPASGYQLLTEDQPLLVTSTPALPGEVERPPDWPPFPLHAFDRGVPDGWYSYRVSGIDIFGRYSAQSAAGAWYQWTPPPRPRPWYYRNPPGDTVVHPFAVRQIDTLAPPPPTAVEAYVLDPADPTVVQDAAYSAWRATLSPAERETMIGLRVSWRWTLHHIHQAPDTQEFRLYYSPGLLNAVGGKVLSVGEASSGPTECEVGTNIAPTAPANVYAGTVLRVGAHSFKVVAALSGTPLRVRVKKPGPNDDLSPQAGARCSLVIPEGHPLAVDYTRAANWQERYYVVGYNDHVTMTTDANGQTLRKYEVFLPTPTDTPRQSLPLVPSLARPLAYASIGISSADNKTYRPDAPQWSSGQWGNRSGNEGRVSSPVTIFRVLREKPEPPVLPDFPERVYASRADYYGHSFYTYRWLPQEHLKALIFRSLDETIFKVDWAQRPRTLLQSSDTGVFPADARWDAAKREQVADELNHLNTFSHDEAGVQEALTSYRILSDDSLRVLASLPGNERAFVQVTIQPLDPDDPANANRLGPDTPPDVALDPALRASIDTLDGRATNRYFYRVASIDQAQNRSGLSLASPPVYLPKVVP